MADWVFRPAEVAAGQWWRLLSHPFVHLTWYHLALDGAAFFLLYGELRRQKGLPRLSVLLGCGGGSLLAAWLWAPQVSVLGLCGLSGTAHGLMAFSGLSQMRSPQTRWVGLLVFGLVVGKSILEGLTGQVLFTFMHMGLCGTPIAMAHLGGVAGGMVAYFIGSVSRAGALDFQVAIRR
ncbi:MAG: rhombosortase [Desulfobacterales bacterium]